jgi:SM-20-related protein
MDDVFSAPPPYWVIANWLGRDISQWFFDYAQQRRDRFRRDQKQIDLAVPRLTKLRELGELRGEFLAHAQAELPVMFQQLGLLPFEPSKFELEMVAHGDGAFRKRRRYVFIGNDPKNRRAIAAVYYFHRIPKSFSGGVLRIYPFDGSKKTGTFVDIEPANDTLVFFPSWFPHEVLPVACPSGRFQDSLFAINCWIHC